MSSCQLLASLPACPFRPLLQVPQTILQLVSISYCFLCRDMIQKTFKEKGLPYVSQLALQNIQELKGIIKWNAEHGIRLFRCLAQLLTRGGAARVYVGHGLGTGQHRNTFKAQSGCISAKGTAAAVHLQDDFKFFSLVHIL